MAVPHAENRLQPEKRPTGRRTMRVREPPASLSPIVGGGANASGRDERHPGRTVWGPRSHPRGGGTVRGREPPVLRSRAAGDSPMRSRGRRHPAAV